MHGGGEGWVGGGEGWMCEKGSCHRVGMGYCSMGDGLVGCCREGGDGLGIVAGWLNGGEGLGGVVGWGGRV